MAENFDLIFGQNASQQYAWNDADYQNGWETIGNIPPTAAQFDALQRRSDTKLKELNDELTPLVNANTAETRQPATAYNEGDMKFSPLLPTGWFLSCVVAGTTSAGEIVLPSPVVENASVIDGTVTWKIADLSAYLPLSGGTMTGNITNALINRSNSAGESIIYGGTGSTDGALIGLRGATNTTYGADQAGSFYLGAGSGTGPALLGKTDGGLLWDTKPVLYPMATYPWGNGEEWYIGYKYPNGEFIMHGYAVQAANTLGITLTYPIPLVASVMANATIVAKPGTAYCGLVSFTYGTQTGTQTVGHFTVRSYNYATPTDRIGICFTVRGRWTL